MNNTVEKWLFGFPRYSGYSIEARWTNVQATDVKFSQDLKHQKSLKSVNFWQSYLKNKKVRGRFFGIQCRPRPLYNDPMFLYICVRLLLLCPRERWRSIVMSTSVCVSVCLSARISPESRTWSLPIFLCMLPMAVARSSSGRVTKSQGMGQFWGFSSPSTVQKHKKPELTEFKPGPHRNTTQRKTRHDDVPIVFRVVSVYANVCWMQSGPNLVYRLVPVIIAVLCLSQ